MHYNFPIGGRSLHGSVNWNFYIFVQDMLQWSRSLHGSVNWNNWESRRKDLYKKSLPTRERELKYRIWILIWRKISVAPYTGAWIEINSLNTSTGNTRCRSLHGSVNWNKSSPSFACNCCGRSLHGSVNWNFHIALAMSSFLVAPYTGAWIEMPLNCLKTVLNLVAPYTGAWIEIKINSLEQCRKSVAPYTGAWIEIVRRIRK